MAIRVRALLRKWFGRGMYPTAEQFSDLFDSFFHKTEDKIPMSGVEGLTDQLNGKYSTAEGRELEKRVQKVTTDLSAHVASSEKAFNEVQNDIETLDRKIDDEAQKREQGDAATLRAANEHTDAAVAEEASARESGDRATLQSAKDYVDKAIAELVDGSPGRSTRSRSCRPPWATIRISLRPLPRRSARRSIRLRARAFLPKTTPRRRRRNSRVWPPERTTTSIRPRIPLR